VGDLHNWESAFSKGNIWGVSNNRRGVWGKLCLGDFVFFYVEAPVSAIVGYGKVIETFHDPRPFFARDWHKESEWPWRFKFEVLWPGTKDVLGPGPRVRLQNLKIEPRESFHRLSIRNNEELLRRCGQKLGAA
jgi:hypothetical protein